jgi:hypothetical protein
MFQGVKRRLFLMSSLPLLDTGRRLECDFVT